MLLVANCHFLGAIDDGGVFSATGMEGFGAVWAVEVVLDGIWTSEDFGEVGFGEKMRSLGASLT